MPEMFLRLEPGVLRELQSAPRLAEDGHLVLVSVLIDRRDT